MRRRRYTHGPTEAGRGEGDLMAGYEGKRVYLWKLGEEEVYLWRLGVVLMEPRRCT